MPSSHKSSKKWLYRVRAVQCRKDVMSGDTKRDHNHNTRVHVTFEAQVAANNSVEAIVTASEFFSQCGFEPTLRTEWTVRYSQYSPSGLDYLRAIYPGECRLHQSNL